MDPTVDVAQLPCLCLLRVQRTRWLFVDSLKSGGTRFHEGCSPRGLLEPAQREAQRPSGVPPLLSSPWHSKVDYVEALDRFQGSCLSGSNHDVVLRLEGGELLGPHSPDWRAFESALRVLDRCGRPELKLGELFRRVVASVVFVLPTTATTLTCGGERPFFGTSTASIGVVWVASGLSPCSLATGLAHELIHTVINLDDAVLGLFLGSAAGKVAAAVPLVWSPIKRTPGPFDMAFHAAFVVAGLVGLRLHRAATTGIEGGGEHTLARSVSELTRHAALGLTPRGQAYLAALRAAIGPCSPSPHSSSSIASDQEGTESGEGGGDPPDCSTTEATMPPPGEHLWEAGQYAHAFSYHGGGDDDCRQHLKAYSRRHHRHAGGHERRLRWDMGPGHNGYFHIVHGPTPVDYLSQANTRADDRYVTTLEVLRDPQWRRSFDHFTRGSKTGEAVWLRAGGATRPSLEAAEARGEVLVDGTSLWDRGMRPGRQPGLGAMTPKSTLVLLERRVLRARSRHIVADVALLARAQTRRLGQWPDMATRLITAFAVFDEEVEVVTWPIHHRFSRKRGKVMRKPPSASSWQQIELHPWAVAALTTRLPPPGPGVFLVASSTREELEAACRPGAHTWVVHLRWQANGRTIGGTGGGDDDRGARGETTNKCEVQ